MAAPLPPLRLPSWCTRLAIRGGVVVAEDGDVGVRSRSVPAGAAAAAAAAPSSPAAPPLPPLGACACGLPWRLRPWWPWPWPWWWEPAARCRAHGCTCAIDTIEGEPPGPATAAITSPSSGTTRLSPRSENQGCAAEWPPPPAAAAAAAACGEKPPADVLLPLLPAAVAVAAVLVVAAAACRGATSSRWRRVTTAKVDSVSCVQRGSAGMCVGGSASGQSRVQVARLVNGRTIDSRPRGDTQAGHTPIKTRHRRAYHSAHGHTCTPPTYGSSAKAPPRSSACSSRHSASSQQ